NALRRVRETGRTLFVAVIVAALLRAVAAFVLAVAVLAVLDLVLGLPAAVRLVGMPMAGGLALGLAWHTWRRGRAVRSAPPVALWIEERMPALRFALATIADERLPPGPFSAELERFAASHGWSSSVRRAILRAWL